MQLGRLLILMLIRTQGWGFGIRLQILSFLLNLFRIATLVDFYHGYNLGCENLSQICLRSTS